MTINKWLSNSFDDYELIDAGGGQKLERWGEIYTIRPDVNAYFSPGLPKEQWNSFKPLVFKEFENTKGKWSSTHTNWHIAYRSLVFNLETTKFKHVGLFPEQEVNWKFITQHLNPSHRFLNLFAYTGAASMVARATGAEVIHVDSVKQLISWARKNMESSQLDGIKWVHEDALKFAQREVKRGNKYDGIIMDPPAWGIGAKGEKWKIEDQLEPLIQIAYSLLDNDGFLILNTYSPRISLDEINRIAKKYFNRVETGELWSKAKSGKELFYGHLMRATKDK